MLPPEEELMDGLEDCQLIMVDSVPGEDVIGGCVEPVPLNMRVNVNSSGSNHGSTCNNISSAGLSSPLPPPQLSYHQHQMNPNNQYQYPSFCRSYQPQIPNQTPRWGPRVSSSGPINNHFGQNNDNNTNNNSHCGGDGDLRSIAAQLQKREQHLGAVASTSTSGGLGFHQQHLVQSSSQNGGLMSDNLDFSSEQKPLNNNINNHHQQQQEEEESRRKRKMEEAIYFDRVEKRLEMHTESLTNRVMNALKECDCRMMARQQDFIREWMKRAANEAAAWRDQVIGWVSHREAIIISQLERVTGQKIYLPPLNFNMMMTMSNTAGAADDAVHHQYQQQQQQQGVDPSPVSECPLSGDHHQRDEDKKGKIRWTEVEVHALIEIRSLMEPEFNESTGSKSQLWDEISSRMKLRGLVSRKGHRCREKWDNCIKYYRRYKEEEAEANGNGSCRKRTRHSRTKSYFELLDEFHAKHGSLPSPESEVAAGGSSENPSSSQSLTQ